MSTTQTNHIPRPPIVTVMGHIDHGKSTLLDYIRKSKVTETEAGGITQHLSAYEVEHATESGETRKITFLDTPGHEAFQHLRSRGSQTADLAILVVAADDGIKPQTLEALKAITEAKIPYIVAITKIDKENANVERAKSSCLEHGIYLEGLGGSVPYVPISSKTGEGIPALLDLLLLAADLEELTGDQDLPASGQVIESHCDPKRGISAALIIRNGSLRSGQYVVVGSAFAPLRIVEDFRGKTISEATFSSPIMVVGFSEIPPVGARFATVPDKKTAQQAVKNEANTSSSLHTTEISEDDERFVVPVVVKADVIGSLEAIVHELKKQEDEKTVLKIVREGVGAITEGDIKCAAGSSQALIIGFNVSIDSAAQELAERETLKVNVFQIIYELTEWLPGAIEARRPAVTGEIELGTAQVLKCFSYTKKAQTIGCRVESGTLSVGDRIKVALDEPDGDRTYVFGRVDTLKSGKSDVSKIESGNDCGAQISIEYPRELAYGDTVSAFTIGSK
jgi:translation initiation factor IF-2